MLKIKRTLNDHIKEKDFLKAMFINPEQIQKFSGNLFIRALNHILPPQKKFLRETFNAIENGKILAQVSLVPDKFSKLRYQISSIKIRQGNDLIAKTLLDYVINKYGGSGVQSFMVYIDENTPDLINLFKNECGFRSCSKIEFYTTFDLTNSFDEFDENNFQDFENKFVSELLEINTMNIFSHFRPAFISRTNDFKHKFLKQTNDDFFKVYMINNRPEGYLRLYSKDGKNYVADIITSKAYEYCYKEIIAYIQNHLKYKNSEFNSLTILVKKYRETSKLLEQELGNGNYKITNTTHILVKDYWGKIKENQIEEKIFMFLNDLTAQPARYDTFMVQSSQKEGFTT